MIEKEQIVEIDGDWDETQLLFTGTCEINYPNEDRYKGDVESNIREGFGTYFYSNQDIYEGDWTAGRKHGKGKMTYSNGTFFEGGWKKG